MRRSDREIKSMDEMVEIIEKADVCRVAFADNNVPYIAAMNFGFNNSDKPVLYFHGAREGKKLDIIARNDLVCFQVDVDHELFRGEQACDWSMNYRSVVGWGRASVVTDREERIKGLNLIMKHYTGNDSFSYNEQHLEMTAVIKVEITEMTGKKKGY